MRPDLVGDLPVVDSNSAQYTVSVSVKNLKLRDTIYEFLQRTYKSWGEVLDSSSIRNRFSGPFIDEDLQNNKNRCSIGFEYTADFGPELEYHYSLMRWVAILAGKRRRYFRDTGAIDRASPYLVLDNHETRPVWFYNDWSDVAAPGTLVDDLGMRLDDTVERDLAWRFISSESYFTAGVIFRELEDIREFLIEEGQGGAKDCLEVIRTQLAITDVLWRKQLSRIVGVVRT